MLFERPEFWNKAYTVSQYNPVQIPAFLANIYTLSGAALSLPLPPPPKQPKCLFPPFKYIPAPIVLYE